MSEQLVVHIRSEATADAAIIREIHEQAFGKPREAGIVDKVRQSPGFVPDLSLIAAWHGQSIGHALLSKVAIEGAGEPISVVALGPIAVRPAFQRQGVGSQLIQEAITRAQALGYCAMVVIGHPSYYPRFGFRPGSRFGLTCAFAVPDEVFMVLPLRAEGLVGVTGTVVYPPAFGE